MGAAYIFVRSLTTWAQQARLLPPGADQFGYSVAISGSTAIVGSPYTNSNSGAAFIYVRTGTTWTQQAELTASDSAVNDLFGASVAVTGSEALVGAYNKNSAVGAAYVFAL